MPSFTSTREILRVEGVTIDQLAGTRLPAGTQLTAVSLTTIDAIDPSLSPALQENDASVLFGRFFFNFQGQPVREGPGEDVTFIIDGVEVAQQVPDISSAVFQGGLGTDVLTDGGLLDSPRFVEFGGTVYIIPNTGVDVSNVTEITNGVTLANPGVNVRISVDTTDFVPVDGAPAPVDPAPVDPAPVDPAPVDPAPVDPAPVDPSPEPINVINGGRGNDRLAGTANADEINGNRGNDLIIGRGGATTF